MGPPRTALRALRQQNRGASRGLPLAPPGAPRAGRALRGQGWPRSSPPSGQALSPAERQPRAALGASVGGRGRTEPPLKMAAERGRGHLPRRAGEKSAREAAEPPRVNFPARAGIPARRSPRRRLAAPHGPGRADGGAGPSDGRPLGPAAAGPLRGSAAPSPCRILPAAGPPPGSARPPSPPDPPGRRSRCLCRRRCGRCAAAAAAGRTRRRC